MNNKSDKCFDYLKNNTTTMVKEEESDGFMECINHYNLSDLCLTSLYLFVQFNSMNLLNIPSKDAYSYARASLDLLFSEEEQKTSVVVKTNKVENNH